MSREAFVVFGDLFPEVFLFNIKECLWIFTFDTSDEKSEEAFDKIADAFEHNWKRGGYGLTDEMASIKMHKAVGQPFFAFPF